MQFDNGAVTEEGNCGDRASIEGYWAFSKNEDSLMTYATRRVNDGRRLDGSAFVGGKIVSFSVDKFVLTLQADTIEFSPR